MVVSADGSFPYQLSVKNLIKIVLVKTFHFHNYGQLLSLPFCHHFAFGKLMIIFIFLIDAGFETPNADFVL